MSVLQRMQQIFMELVVIVHNLQTIHMIIIPLIIKISKFLIMSYVIFKNMKNFSINQLSTMMQYQQQYMMHQHQQFSMMNNLPGVPHFFGADQIVTGAAATTAAAAAAPHVQAQVNVFFFLN